jgi:hypothetical protein
MFVTTGQEALGGAETDEIAGNIDPFDQYDRRPLTMIAPRRIDPRRP